MYNIEFRVAGRIVSINVALNDTLSTLTNQMKELDAFKKYSSSELQDKLVKNLIQVSKSVTLDPKIKQRVVLLLKQDSESTPVKKSDPKLNLNNHTFVNILQQSNINSSYLANGVVSQTKLRRKYISEGPLPNCEELIQNKLKFDYNKGLSNNLNVQTSSKNSELQLPNSNKRAFDYLQEKPNFQQNCYKHQARDFITEKQSCMAKRTTNYQNSTEKSPLKSEKVYEKSYQARVDQNLAKKFFHERETSLYARNQPYDPVPKLNELIHKSRSLSQMIQLNHGAELRERNKKMMPQEFEIRKTAGKIHHRENVVGRNQNKKVDGQREQSLDKREISLKINYNTSKSRETSQRQFLRQIEENVQKEKSLYSGQNTRNYRQNKKVYSYF